MGIMGAAMAANLARQGYSGFVWNRTPGRVGEYAASAAGASSKARFPKLSGTQMSYSPVLVMLRV